MPKPREEMKTHTYTTLPERYGDHVTTYTITRESIQGVDVYWMEVTIGKESPQRLNSQGKPCEATHRLFEFEAAKKGMRKHNQANGKHTLVELK